MIGKVERRPATFWKLLKMRRKQRISGNKIMTALLYSNLNHTTIYGGIVSWAQVAGRLMTTLYIVHGPKLRVTGVATPVQKS